MRAAIGVVAVLAGCGLAVAADGKYESKDGKFKVAFPKDAKVKTVDQTAGATKINMFVADGGDKAHLVMVMSLPDEVKTVPAKTLLDKVEKGPAQKGGKLISTRDMTFGPDKLPAREVQIEKDGKNNRLWIIIAGTRLYMVSVAGKGDYATTKEATAFLESFEITK